MFASARTIPVLASTVVVLTSGTTWVVPAGVTTLKSVECWGAGGGGYATGGGGGAYAAITNLAVTAGSSVTMQIGSGGVGNSGPTPGNDASGTTWFNSTATVLADYGRGGAVDTSNGLHTTATGLGGVPGLAANCVGTTKFSGGYGGAASESGQPVNYWSGGGSSATPSGAGTQGGSDYDTATSTAIVGNGGSAPGGGAGGAGNLNTGTAGAGGAGQSNQNGGGGGAANSWNDCQAGGDAGFPGGGGGGGCSSSGVGGGGQIRITY